MRDSTAQRSTTASKTADSIREIIDVPFQGKPSLPYESYHSTEYCRCLSEKEHATSRVRVHDTWPEWIRDPCGLCTVNKVYISISKRIVTRDIYSHAVPWRIGDMDVPCERDIHISRDPVTRYRYEKKHSTLKIAGISLTPRTRFPIYPR
jgi:hypothetical protein